MKIAQLLILIILTMTFSYSNDLSKNDEEFYKLYKNLQWNEINLSTAEKNGLIKIIKLEQVLGFGHLICTGKMVFLKGWLLII